MLLQKCKVSIRFSPTLRDEDIRREAVKLIVDDLERKAAEQEQQLQQRAIEQERDGPSQEIQVFLSKHYVLIYTVSQRKCRRYSGCKFIEVKCI